MLQLIKRWIRKQAHEHGRLLGLYIRSCRPDGEEWAAFLKSRKSLHSMGEHCSIQTNVEITDPAYVRIGNNVRLSGCTLFGHDGSVNMLNRAFGLKLDSVGKIDIRDNVFIGHRAIVLPNVEIGPNAIVAAGAVVTRNVPENTVVGGIPAKRICSLTELVDRIKVSNATLPWMHLIRQRAGAFDAALQPEIDEVRINHFFGPESQPDPSHQEPSADRAPGVSAKAAGAL
jgi:acetyltransferase-like isoleucine patch superfamily enzyme